MSNDHVFRKNIVALLSVQFFILLAKKQLKYFIHSLQCYLVSLSDPPKLYSEFCFSWYTFHLINFK